VYIEGTTEHNSQAPSYERTYIWILIRGETWNSGRALRSIVILTCLPEDYNSGL
jgi:hypothetical protein